MKIYNSIILKALIAFLAGSCGVFAFSPFDNYIAINGVLIFLSFTILLWLIRALSPKDSKWIGFSWGLGFFGFGVNWVYVSVAGFGGMPFFANISIVGLLIAYLSIYPALFAYLFNKIRFKSDLLHFVLVSPIFWHFTEFLRGWVLSGFPWLQLGYSQIDLPYRHFAPLFGVEGITFFIVMTSGLVVYGFKSLLAEKSNARTSRLRSILIPASTIVLINIIALGLKQIDWYEVNANKALTITLVQPNIDQQLRWEGEALSDIIAHTKYLSEPFIGKSDLIIWPETAIPSIERNQRFFLKELDEQLRENNTALITGLVDMRPNGDTYNIALVLGEDEPYELPEQNGINFIEGTHLRYYKHHLVPFGETVPLQNFIRGIAPFFDLPMSSFSQGTYVAPNLIARNTHFLMAICYEIILGQQLRANITKDTGFIITISNDAWFGESTGPWQHLQMARMRALELARPVLRSTNNGITAIIDADGKIEEQLEQFKDGTLTKKLTPTVGFTFFANYGNFVNWLIIIMFFCVICARIYFGIRNTK